MQGNRPQKVINALSLLFFVSGVSALIYQVAWQRMLFSVLGSDIESVTIIVSAFMLGLGLGALVGGRVIDLVPNKAVLLFSGVEIGIGVFGVFSKSIILGVSSYFYSESSIITALISFSIILCPTLLMGATLPILVSFVARRWANVGSATGHLYSFNTLGAAVGAFATSYCLFEFFTLSECIWLAASMNIGISLYSFALFRGRNA